MVPNLLTRVLQSEGELTIVAELVGSALPGLLHFLTLPQIQKGISSARSDDTKSLKGVVIDWISPRDGPLQPPLSRNIKTTRGFNHPVTGSLLCPAGMDWNDLE